jgi:hypothetical protein
MKWLGYKLLLISHEDMHLEFSSGNKAGITEGGLWGKTRDTTPGL